MIVTIDGPAGSGKSTVARKLAARLEVAYLDTGAMYRAIAHAMLQRDVDLSDEAAVVAVATAMRLDVDCGPTHTRVRVDGHDVSEAIRTMAVSGATARVAKFAEIRTLMVEQQRRIGRLLGSFVTEGRDQGSVVFPAADVKFVLEASPAIRAKRRYQEMVADGQDVTLEAVESNLRQRDAVDAKQWEPLLAESGAAEIVDATHAGISEIVDRLSDIVSRRLGL